MTIPKPTVGRIVHFHPTNPEAAKAKGQPYPAIVTHVWSDQCMNLAIQNDNSHPLDAADLARTSVMEGGPDTPGTWSWPPREQPSFFLTGRRAERTLPRIPA